MVDPPGEPLNKTIDGQPVHKKVFNITNYERNANQNTVSYHPTPVRMAIAKKTR